MKLFGRRKKKPIPSEPASAASHITPPIPGPPPFSFTEDYATYSMGTAFLTFDDGQIHRLLRRSEPYLIGRGPDLDIPIAESSVARRHAYLEYRTDENGWYVRDLSSKNRTRLNGEVLEPGTPYRLTSGDQLTFANVSAKFSAVTTQSAAEQIIGNYKALVQFAPSPNRTFLVLALRGGRALLMKEYACSDDSFKKEILNEFKLGFSISHPALPQDVDLFEENGRLYRVSAYREAIWLESLLAEHGRFEMYAIREWMEQLCDTVQYLINQNPPLYQCDLSPDNLLRLPRGSIGLASLTSAFYHALHRDSFIVHSKLSFVAPEEMVRGTIDERTEVFHLGAALFYLMTGKIPEDFDYDTKIRNARPEYAGIIAGNIVMRCCDPDPENRFQTIAELRQAISQLC